MKKLFIGVAAAFASIPGVAILLKGLGTPPHYETIFGGTIEAFGTLSLLVLWLNKGKLKKIPYSKVTKWAVALAIVSLISMLAYIGLFKYCVISHPTHDTAYFPLWTSGDIARYVEKAGGRWAALDRYGIFAVESAIQRMPTYAIVITTIVLLLVYQIAFTSLTLAFGLLGFRRADRL